MPGSRTRMSRRSTSAPRPCRTKTAATAVARRVSARMHVTLRPSHLGPEVPIADASSRRASGDGVRNRRRQRGGGAGCVRAVRGDRAVPDHARVTDGRAFRCACCGRDSEPLGHGTRGHRDAVGGGRGRRTARRHDTRRARNDVHREPGPPPDAAEHVQDRGRAVACGHSRRRPGPRDARALDLRRSQRRDGRPTNRLGNAVRVVAARGCRLRADRPRCDAGVARPVPALLRRVPDEPRDRGASRSPTRM